MVSWALALAAVGDCELGVAQGVVDASAGMSALPAGGIAVARVDVVGWAAQARGDDVGDWCLLLGEVEVPDNNTGVRCAEGNARCLPDDLGGCHLVAGVRVDVQHDERGGVGGYPDRLDPVGNAWGDGRGQDVGVDPGEDSQSARSDSVGAGGWLCEELPSPAARHVSGSFD